MEKEKELEEVVFDQTEEQLEQVSNSSQEDKIRTLAYSLWLSRGAPLDNDSVVDWIEAEKQVLS